MPRNPTRPALFLATLTAAGCASRPIAEVTPVPDLIEIKPLPVNRNRNLDLLFVIDNSVSMRDEQATLQRNFDQFINVLDGVVGGLPDLHLGVVTTDAGSPGPTVDSCSGNGDNGALQTERHVEDDADNDGRIEPSEVTITPCGLPPGEPFLKYIGGVPNYTGTLQDAFSCIASVGTRGCGFEAPLEATRRALTNAANAGFLRDDAYLAVVFLGDEDDCSAASSQLLEAANLGSALGPLSSFRCFDFGVACEENPRTPGAKTDCAPREDSGIVTGIAEYVDFLRGLKTDPRDVIVSAITGPATPVEVFLDDDDDRPQWPTLREACSYTPAGSSSPQSAAPSVRLHGFLDEFPDRNARTTICNDDLTDGLTTIAQLITDVVGNPCLDSPLLDANPDLAGLQAECLVTEVRYGNTADEERRVVPACDGGSTLPCWAIVPSAECLNGVDAIEIRRADSDVPPRGTVDEVACAIEPLDDAP